MKWPKCYLVCGLTAFFVVIVQLLTGCSSVPYPPPAQARLLVGGQISIGASRDEVVKLLGAPQRKEMQGTTEFLFYRLAWQFKAYEDERNPIAIKDGKVVGFGKANYDSVVKAQAEEKKQQSTAKKH